MKQIFLIASMLYATALTGAASAQDEPKPKIGALTKSLANPFFLRMKEGYEYAQKKFGIDLVFGSTPTEEANVEQLNILQTWFEEGSIEGYVITPFRPNSLNPILTRISRENIPIINIDELIPEDTATADNIKIVTRIASDNVEAGRLPAQFLLNSIPEGSQVAIIEGDPGTVSSRDRVMGFARAAKEGGLVIIASQPANWNRKKAYELATIIIKQAPDLKAFFVANDDMAMGVIRALQETGFSEQVMIVSVDGIPDAIEAVKEGTLAGTVAQYPDAMAYMAIETMLKTLNGQEVPAHLDSPIKLITKDNLSDAGNYFKEE